LNRALHIRLLDSVAGTDLRRPEHERPKRTARILPSDRKRGSASNDEHDGKPDHGTATPDQR
jgi:hypothetical protein